MPSLPGYEARTHSLPGDREIDILYRSGGFRLWVPGQQVAALTGDGLRATGFYSTSDIAKTIDPMYSQRVSDPRRLYSRSSVRYTTLFAVEGLIQRTFHTDNPRYVEFCRDFIAQVLPAYDTFGDQNAELIMAWQAAIKYYTAKGRRPPTGFYEAVTRQGRRLAASDPGYPCLILGTDTCTKVVSRTETDDRYQLVKPPIADADLVLDYGVADLHKARVRAAEFNKSSPKEPVVVHLAFAQPDGVLRILDPVAKLIATYQPAEPREQPTTEQPTGKTGPTIEEMQDALQRVKEELLTSIEPMVGKAIRAHSDQAHQATVIKLMSEQVEQIVQMTLVNREQLALSRQSNELAQKSIELSRQSIDLITPSHQLFLPASDYIKMDGVEEALRRAPRLAKPSFGLDHCPDLGKASLWMKRLCRAEDKKVAANAVARIIAKDAGQEEPPLYIPEFRWKRLTQEHVRVLMFNPACWARLKQTFLPPDTPTLLFPGPKTQPAPETGKTEEA
jgi:hypothetical protein